MSPADPAEDLAMRLADLSQSSMFDVHPRPHDVRQLRPAFSRALWMFFRVCTACA
jgi:hypothetical protein